MKCRMKTWMKFFCVMMCIAGMVFGQAPKATKEDPEFVEARRLFWSGQYKESEKMFQEYLSDHPDHEASRSFLQMIAQSRIYDPNKIDETNERLAQVRVSKVEFRDVDFKKVLTFLQTSANPKVNGQDPVKYINFINMIPTGYSPKITITLADMSVLEAIEKVTSRAGLRFVIDTYAVIVDLPEGKK